MADLITYDVAKHRYSCGNDYTNISVVNFKGPDNSKIVAYSCNMNIDLDGDPQAYAPLGNSKLKPMDFLGNAGWKSAAQNTALKAKYEADKKTLADLEQKLDTMKKALGGAPPSGAPSARKPPVTASKGAVPDPAIALQKQIDHFKTSLRAQSFTYVDGKKREVTPKNFEKIFWKWYGVVALTPGERDRTPKYLEMGAPVITMRKPVLDETPIYEDVFGRFPVVQSIFEPGTDYFISSLPRAANTNFPSWDQRYFIPSDSSDQQPFGAITGQLTADTGLRLNDKVFGIRLDTNDTLKFPFRDSGNGYKVSECSFGTFLGLGGDYHPERKGAARYPNDFLLVYLAFPGGTSPASMLQKFSTAANSDDFPVMLAFLAQAASNGGRNGAGGKAATNDPMGDFSRWKKSGSAAKPAAFDVIRNGLSAAGSNFVQRMSKNHPSLFPGGLQLKL